MTNALPSIVAVIVSYNPDLAVLARLIDVIVPQVTRVVIVDNGSGEAFAAWIATKSEKIHFIALGENKGIATAQNAGICWARGIGADQVLLFDHDSHPPVDLVLRLQAALADLEKSGEKIAAIGPRHVDTRHSGNRPPSPFYRYKRGRFRWVYPEINSPYVPVDFLIASGSLIPMRAMDAIGGMMDELFIDCVDVEWSLRAKQAGWKLYGIWDVMMEHELGDDRVVVLGRSMPIHSPLRHYYTLRNAVWLCCKSRLPFSPKLGIAYNACLRLIAYSLFMPRPFTHFCFMCRGIGHGLRGRMGRL